MVKKVKVSKKKVAKKAAAETDVKAFIHFTVDKDGGAKVEAHATDKDIVALILILFKQLDESGQKVIRSVIKTLDLFDNT